jgi:RHS repeat-associated protein
MGKHSIQDSSTFTGKERDEETGYGYFGARYVDYELMTMWLSVDPMSDKYPSISPYAYCAWNPVKLVDPDGNEFFITGGDGVKYYLTINKDRSLRWVSRDGQSYNIEDNPWVSKLTTAITTLMGKSKTAENVITTLVKDPNHDIEKYAVWVENRVRHEMGLPRRLYYYFNVKTNVGAGCIGGINFNDTL